MPAGLEQLDAPLARLDGLLEGIAPSASMRSAIDRWRSDAAALRFHLRPRDADKPLLLAVIGGTGTGKSTLLNRIVGAEATAASFRRTFTSGCVAVAGEAADLPRNWLGLEHQIVSAEQLPARGQSGSLLVVPRSVLPGTVGHEAILRRVVLVDTPDLDGDHPAHHAEADRAFRWAQALLVLVTPEKYQMTELLPYYRLAARYGIASLFVMNKCEEQAVLDDYRHQMAERLHAAAGDDATPTLSGISAGGVPLFVIARDDAGFEPPPDQNLDRLRDAIVKMASARSAPGSGVSNRAADIASRFQDQILVPLRTERREADRLAGELRQMETPAPGVDVNPVTQELERRLQQRSVLYLMGPQRVLDRVRQAPAMLVRLPRIAWDYLMRGDLSGANVPTPGAGKTEAPPDFRTMLIDQFSVLQSRIDDLLRSSSIAQQWMAAGPKAYEQARIAPEEAGKIVDEELAELRQWLERRWNATPRDTRVVQSLLRYLPGGTKLTHLTEAAPYLLALGLIAHHALFGTDLLVIGGYTVATWLTERLSNEVAVHTRATNARIADRFARLAHDQIQKTLAWLNHQAAPAKSVDQLERAFADFSSTANIAR